MKENKKGTELAKVLWYYNFIPNIDNVNQKIICPFHKDVNPSLIVNFEEGNWFCFGCNKSGDASKFVNLMEKQHNNLNDLQCLKQFQKILKSNKCSNIKIKASQKALRSSRMDFYNEAYDYYYGLRKVNWKAPEEPEEIHTKQYMKDRGFKTKALIKSNAKVTYNKSYPIIFPMLDNGEFKGWVCRTTNKEIEQKRKYLYNKGFSRATTLVGDYGSKNFVIVVEGYMDRLKFLQYGENNVVAILGWKITNEQIDKLKKQGIKTIISALDNDECGKKGTKYLQKYFNVIRWKYLKNVKDPGEMSQEVFNKCLKKTKETFRQNITKGGKVNGID